MVEEEEQEAKVALHAGLEHAVRQREDTIDAFGAYVPDTTTGEDEQALSQVAYQIARADFVTAAGAAYQVEKKRLYRQHSDTLKSANEWRMSIQDMNERDRQRVQRGKIVAAIEEVQRDVPPS
jgi:hypothetical protein